MIFYIELRPILNVKKLTYFENKKVYYKQKKFQNIFLSFENKLKFVNFYHLNFERKENIICKSNKKSKMKF